jgi:imidazolonepropionase-like amidohydrolase
MKNRPFQLNTPIVINYLSLALLTISFSCKGVEKPESAVSDRPITELNSHEIPIGEKTYAILDVSLVDGLSDTPIKNTSILIEKGRISEVGKNDSFQIPDGAEIVNGQGLTLMPGLIDAHYHNSKGYPAIYLKRGITSLRDPGIWIEDYDGERQSGASNPRLFLTGPHLDMPPPTYPNDAYVVRDKKEVREAMKFLLQGGGTAIKVYLGLSLGLIEEACNIAHAHGLPVTGHLEIVDARQAIEAGLDGIEHITSFGTALIPQQKAEVYRQRILENSGERRPGRYEMWKDIDVNSKAADSLLKFLVSHQTFVTPTLGAFEYRLGDTEKDSTKHLGFQNMIDFVGRCQESGVRIVVGSHGPWNKYVETGWTYQHEMELFSKSGMSNMNIIKAATIENAKFFRVDDRLGSIEIGKQADLVLIKGDPIANLKDIYNVEKVMLNGKWVD